MENDMIMYIISDHNENELAFTEVLYCLIETLHILFKNQLEKRTLLENFDLILLAVDEMVDNGYVCLTLI